MGLELGVRVGLGMLHWERIDRGLTSVNGGYRGW
jgi:hypothetical protein